MLLEVASLVLCSELLTNGYILTLYKCACKKYIVVVLKECLLQRLITYTYSSYDAYTQNTSFLNVAVVDNVFKWKGNTNNLAFNDFYEKSHEFVTPIGLKGSSIKLKEMLHSPFVSGK